MDLRFIRRIAATVAGSVLIIVGVALLVLPGPGVVVIAAGVALLGTQYEWARRLVHGFNEKIQAKVESVGRGRKKPPGNGEGDG
jgi:drug/metabolite transporter (DMT)-like permease